MTLTVTAKLLGEEMYLRQKIFQTFKIVTWEPPHPGVRACRSQNKSLAVVRAPKFHPADDIFP